MSPGSHIDLDLHIASPLDPTGFNKEYDDLSASLMPQQKDRINHE
jgi:hypothetical protein